MEPAMGASILSTRGEWRALLAVSGIAAVLLLGFCLLPTARRVDFLSDDAYYYFGVAEHLAEGRGPTFDGITWTTGFHPLYAFLLAGLRRGLGLGRPGLVLASKILNSLAFLGAGALLGMAGRRLWNPSAGRWAAILWFSNPNALLLVGTGMEGAVYAFALAAFLAALAGASASMSLGRLAGCGALAGVCVLGRTDALLLLPLVAGLRALVRLAPVLRPAAGSDRPAWSRELGRAVLEGAVFIGVALLPFLVWLAFARHHTGTWIQGSAQMKRIWRASATEGLGLWGTVWFSGGILGTWLVKSLFKVPSLKYLLPVAPGPRPATPLRNPREGRWILHLLWLFPLALGLAYSVGLPKTWTWYYTPGLVTLSLLAAGLLAAAARRGGRYRRLAPLLLALTALESYGYLAVKAVRGRHQNQRDMIETAAWIREHLPEEARLAAWNSGIYGWHSGRTVINLDGLINNEIAGVIRSGRRLGDYLREREVTHVVDVSSYMEKHIPEWTEGVEYRQVHRHDSAHMRPISVWELMP